MKTSSAIFFAIVTLMASANATTTADHPSNFRQWKRGGAGGRGGGRRCQSDHDNTSDDGSCDDPAGAVLDLLNCVEMEDGACAAAAYDPGFQRFHNEAFTGEIAVADPEFWDGAFTVLDFVFDIRFASNPNPNQASVRYIENVTTSDGLNMGQPSASTEYPFSVTLTQHEHAIVEVDDDCKIKVWDQYGDDQEQVAVDVAVADLICATGGC